MATFKAISCSSSKTSSAPLLISSSLPNNFTVVKHPNPKIFSTPKLQFQASLGRRRTRTRTRPLVFAAMATGYVIYFLFFKMTTIFYVNFSFDLNHFAEFSWQPFAHKYGWLIFNIGFCLFSFFLFWVVKKCARGATTYSFFYFWSSSNLWWQNKVRQERHNISCHFRFCPRKTSCRLTKYWVPVIGFLCMGI